MAKHGVVVVVVVVVVVEHVKLKIRNERTEVKIAKWQCLFQLQLSVLIRASIELKLPGKRR